MRTVMIVLVIALGGCGVGLDTPSKNKAREAIQKIRYIKDPATDLCFALVSTSHQLNPSDDGLTITWVPCEPKVLEQIGK